MAEKSSLGPLRRFVENADKAGIPPRGRRWLAEQYTSVPESGDSYHDSLQHVFDFRGAQITRAEVSDLLGRLTGLDHKDAEYTTRVGAIRSLAEKIRLIAYESRQEPTEIEESLLALVARMVEESIYSGRLVVLPDQESEPIERRHQAVYFGKLAFLANAVGKLEQRWQRGRRMERAVFDVKRLGELFDQTTVFVREKYGNDRDTLQFFEASELYVRGLLNEGRVPPSDYMYFAKDLLVARAIGGSMPQGVARVRHAMLMATEDADDLASLMSDDVPEQLPPNWQDPAQWVCLFGQQRSGNASVRYTPLHKMSGGTPIGVDTPNLHFDPQAVGFARGAVEFLLQKNQ